MGVSGSGIFDNDTCGDFLGDICEQLLEAIRTDVESFENGYLERAAPAAISVLLGIAKHIPISRCFIDPPEITALRDQYLKWFDANMHESGGKADFLQQWRSGAEQEFNTLIAICSKK
jgi:hypothetical protein